MESKPKSTPREKFPLPEKFSPEEYQTHDAASHKTASPTPYKLSYSGPLILQYFCHDCIFFSKLIL